MKVVFRPMVEKSVLLVGTSKSAFDVDRDLAWVRDNNAEMWTLNNFYAAKWLMPYFFDRVFQCHEDDLGEYWKLNFNMCGGIGVFFDSIQAQVSGIYRKEFIDIDYAEKMYGPKLLSSSFSYMLMHAYDLGYRKIRLCGVSMAKGEDYEYQIPAIIEWLSRLRRLGHEVESDMESSWLETLSTIDWSKIKSLNICYGRKNWVNPVGLAKKTTL